jgi:MFS family permease
MGSMQAAPLLGAGGDRPWWPWRRRGLWRNGAFLTLWAGQTVSEFGSRVTGVALPLVAVLLLGATPQQMGLLSGLQYLPVALASLVAGVWVDRLRRRPLLIATNLIMAAIIGTVPLAAAAGQLRIEQLYVVGPLMGLCGVVFGLAYAAYFRSLVSRHELLEGNTKLRLTSSAAAVAGPGVGGALVQLASAPLALLIDSLSYLVAAVSVWLIRVPEALPLPASRRSGLWREMAEGLRLVWCQPMLRHLGLGGAAWNLFGGASAALWPLYVTRELGLSPAVFGALAIAGSLGGLLGALMGERLARRIGVGPILVWSSLLMLAGGGLAPLAGVAAAHLGSGTAAALAVPGAMMLAAEALAGISLAVYVVNYSSLRQAITPQHLQGRVNGSMQVMYAAPVPLGAFAGGTIAQHLGTLSTLWLVALGFTVVCAGLLRSPLRRLRDVPAPIEE